MPRWAKLCGLWGNIIWALINHFYEVLAAGIDIGRLEALDFVATVANAAVLPIY